MEDHSDLLQGRIGSGLSGGESMLAGGASTRPAGRGPGSDSQAAPEGLAGVPGPLIPLVDQDFRRVNADGTRDPSPWATAGGGPWADASEPDPAPGRGGPDGWRQR